MNDETLSLVTRSLNTAMVLVLAVGLTLRYRPKVHMPLMLTAFVVDLVNVLILELSRGAVGQATQAFTDGARFMQFHVLVSALSLVGYGVALVTGTKLYRASRSASASQGENPARARRLRQVHKVNAAIFIFLRLASYVTSFWM